MSFLLAGIVFIFRNVMTVSGCMIDVKYDFEARLEPVSK